MRRTSRAILQAAALVTLVVACGGLFETPYQPAPPPTEDAARRHLAAIVAVATSTDPSTVCRFGGGNCPDELRAADRDAFPETPPTIIATRTMQPTRSGNGWNSGGVLFDLCGRDGLGHAYQSQMLVFDDGSGRLLSINTLYWTGQGISLGNVVGADPTPSPTCPGIDR